MDLSLLKNFMLRCTAVILMLQLVAADDRSGYGLLDAQAMHTQARGRYCIAYNPKFKGLPAKKQNADEASLHDLTPGFLCDPPSPGTDYTNLVVGVSRGNCTFSEKALIVQRNHGQGLIIVSSSGVFPPVANQTSDYNQINITVAMMAKEDYENMKGLGEDLTIVMFSPPTPVMDYNLLVIWVLAVFTVTFGGYWSGMAKYRQYMIRKKKDELPRRVGQDMDQADEEEDANTVDISPKFAIIFVIIMCAMLVALYLLYDYIVYVIIALFCLASCSALYFTTKPLLHYLPPSTQCKVPPNRLPLLKHQPEIRKIFLALLCIGMATWWVVERKKDYAWILQDFLGVIFCIHLMKTVRLPSLKACTILLVLLFFYDIFFVFITPLFTKSGKSVMIDVATGGSSRTQEQLPMVLKVPRFIDSISSHCGSPYSLLGFGDILVPGLLISFCHGFDLQVQSKRVYFIGTVIAYGVGLVLTFIALALMATGQPALLYLVPCTLLTVVGIGVKRRELKHLWLGKLQIKTVTEKSPDSPGHYGSQGETNSAPDDLPGEPDVDVRIVESDRKLLINGIPTGTNSPTSEQ